MTKADLYEALEAIAPTAYLAFPEPEDGTPAQFPPFITYYLPSTDDVFADNTNYRRIYDLTVELCTDEQDEELTRQLEETLARLGITYNRDETWNDAEKVFETVYTGQVIFTED